MTNAIRSGSAVIAAAALLLLSTGAEAVATYRSQLYWGAEPYGPYDQDVTTTTGGSYSLSGTGYSMTTSGSPSSSPSLISEIHHFGYCFSPLYFLLRILCAVIFGRWLLCGFV